VHISLEVTQYLVNANLRDTSPHQDSAGTAPSGTPPPADPTTTKHGEHSPTARRFPLKRPMLTPEGGPAHWSLLHMPTFVAVPCRLYSAAGRFYLFAVRRETGHIHKHTTRATPHNTRPEQHYKRPHEEPPAHLTTIEGGAATVRTTSHTRVGDRAEVSVCWLWEELRWMFRGGNTS